MRAASTPDVAALVTQIEQKIWKVEHAKYADVPTTLDLLRSCLAALKEQMEHGSTPEAR